MLDSKQVRQLAYIIKIDNVTPIPNYDRVELAHIGGWTVVVGKGEFKPNDLAIYFEIDSKLPEVEPFTNMEFLVSKHYKIKTQKMCKSLSQGLLMSAENFGWTADAEAIYDADGVAHRLDDESRFLTKQLGVTYAVADDNRRKSKGMDKYKSMAQRHSKLFSHYPFRWLMKRKWGKKLLFVFFGRKKDKRGWPAWIKKTDEERVENMLWILEDKTPWMATEKIDGTSTTFTLKRNHNPFAPKYEYLVCSRNIAFDKPSKKGFYDTNVYTEMSDKYHIEQVLTNILNTEPKYEYITIQGETYGKGIQDNDYGLNNHQLAIFNVIFGYKNGTNSRLNPNAMHTFLSIYGLPGVPLLDTNYTLPDTIEELRDYVNSETSRINGKMKEGIVFRSFDGVRSFKCVSPEYLMKHHS